MTSTDDNTVELSCQFIIPVAMVLTQRVNCHPDFPWCYTNDSCPRVNCHPDFPWCYTNDSCLELIVILTFHGWYNKTDSCLELSQSTIKKRKINRRCEFAVTSYPTVTAYH